MMQARSQMLSVSADVVVGGDKHANPRVRVKPHDTLYFTTVVDQRLANGSSSKITVAFEASARASQSPPVRRPRARLRAYRANGQSPDRAARLHHAQSRSSSLSRSSRPCADVSPAVLLADASCGKYVTSPAAPVLVNRQMRQPFVIQLNRATAHPRPNSTQRSREIGCCFAAAPFGLEQTNDFNDAPFGERQCQKIHRARLQAF
jgi:hypothetical protein